MTTLAESLIASADRPLALRRRPDVQAQRQTFEGRTYWMLKDPIALRYWRLHEEEYALWQWLDGRRSLQQLKDTFCRQFRPQSIDLDELQSFVAMLHTSGLLLSDAVGQGDRLEEKDRQRKRQGWLNMLTNPLSIRFRGLDPNRLLTVLLPYTAWFFRPWCVVLCLLLALSALLLVVVQYDTLLRKLPSQQDFFTVQNAVWLTVVLCGTKIIHELGHGLACKQQGGQCHEMGVLLLVFTPCLYCDVSDSWMLPSKRGRAFIGAAGMYVEITLASVATFVWWFSQPGLLHHLCLNIMLLCSVSTLMFNGNPLLRYDGYYILSDWLEIPNLRQKADQVLSGTLASLTCGLPAVDDPFLPRGRRLAFALFAVAANIYRWLVTFSILWFLNQFLEPYGLKALGRLLVCVAVAGMVWGPLWKLGKFFSVPGRLDQMKWKRVAATLLVLGSVLAAVAWLPLPHRVQAVVLVEPQDAQPVFVQVAGVLQEVYVKPGQWVNARQKLARLEDRLLERQVAQLVDQVREQQARIDRLLVLQFAQPRVAAQLPQAESVLADLQEQLRLRRQDQARLLLLAPCSGQVLVPSSILRPDPPPHQLSQWTGHPLEPQNLGCTLSTGTLFCQIGDPRRQQAILLIDQSDLEYIRPGQAVHLLLTPRPDQPLHTHLTSLSHEPLLTVPASLSRPHGGPISTTSDLRPLTPLYPAFAPLPSTPHSPLPGTLGHSSLPAPPTPLLTHLSRWLAHTFHFKW